MSSFMALLFFLLHFQFCVGLFLCNFAHFFEYCSLLMPFEAVLQKMLMPLNLSTFQVARSLIAETGLSFLPYRFLVALSARTSSLVPPCKRISTITTLLSLVPGSDL